MQGVGSPSAYPSTPVQGVGSPSAYPSTELQGVDSPPEIAFLPFKMSARRWQSFCLPFCSSARRWQSFCYLSFPGEDVQGIGSPSATTIFTILKKCKALEVLLQPLVFTLSKKKLISWQSFRDWPHKTFFWKRCSQDGLFLNNREKKSYTRQILRRTQTGKNLIQIYTSRSYS